MKSKDIYTLRDAQRRMAPVSFSTMIKPAGSACNLDCTYCYYLDKALQYGGKEAVMSDALLESYIRQYIEANEVESVVFCWHGGEPTLLGVDFYRRAVALQRKYSAGRRIENTLQTNGTTIDGAWCEFFAENDFLVGVSIDGPEDVHDAYRRDRGGRPTFSRVMQGIEAMRRCGVRYNTLSVVSSRCEGRGGEIYRFLRDCAGSRYMQFMPAAEYVADRSGGLRPMIVPPQTEGARRAEWSVSAKGYGDFLCDVFDEWVTRDVGTVFVQMFDATLAAWCGVTAGLCTMCETCGDGLAVEHNGDVYTCDHFVYPEHRLGNITDTPLAELYRSARRVAFGMDKRNTMPAECFRCRYRFACNGGCPQHRFETAADGSPRNSLCEGLYRYFRHAEPYMDRMRELIRIRQSPSWVIPFARKRMGLM